MAALSRDIQVFIVQALARYMRVPQVVKEVKREFDVVVSREQVQFYNPEAGGARKRIAREWKELFHDTRKAFIEGTSVVPIANQVYRLDALQRIANRAESTGNDILLKDVVEQAAKETGGMYTNRRELTGRNGGPIETVGLTVDQWKEQAQKRRQQAEEALSSFTG